MGDGRQTAANGAASIFHIVVWRWNSERPVRLVHRPSPIAHRPSPTVSITIVRLGSPRTPHEGLRLGTVRRPPRGVPKSEFAKRDFYDVWLPALSPSQKLVTFALEARDARGWKAFERKFKAEMREPDATRML